MSTSTETRTVGSSDHSSSQNPDDQLQEWKGELQREESDLTLLTKKRDELKADIVTLEKIVNDLKSILEAYRAASSGLERSKKDAVVYYESKIRMIECAIEDRKDKILKKIEWFDNDLKEKTEQQRRLEEKRNGAEKEFKEAQETQATKQKIFDYWKDYKAKQLDPQLTDAKTLIKNIQSEDGQNHQASMYFLALELDSVLDHTNVIAVEDLKDHLYRAWPELQEATEDVRAKKTAWEIAKNEFDSKQKVLDDLRQKRREKILEIISEYN